MSGSEGFIIAWYSFKYPFLRVIFSISKVIALYIKCSLNIFKASISPKINGHCKLKLLIFKYKYIILNVTKSYSIL